MAKPTLFTIGFTQSTTENFFGRLKAAGVRRVVDVRLNNTSQLAGFAKATDLKFFLGRILGIDYVREPMLAPTEEIVQLGRAKNWPAWETGFRRLMSERGMSKRFNPADLASTCLLCAEAKPHHCHRRIIAELLTAESKTPLAVMHL